jgi:hypothetical protein
MPSSPLPPLSDVLLPISPVVHFDVRRPSRAPKGAELNADGCSTVPVNAATRISLSLRNVAPKVGEVGGADYAGGRDSVGTGGGSAGNGRGRSCVGGASTSRPPSSAAAAAAAAATVTASSAVGLEGHNRLIVPKVKPHMVPILLLPA